MALLGCLLAAGCSSLPSGSNSETGQAKAMQAAPSASAPTIGSSYAVLLDNGDGTTGQLQIQGPLGLTKLEKARSAARFDGPAGERFTPEERCLNQDFADAVQAAPRRPQTWRLYLDAKGQRLTAPSREELPRIREELLKRPGADISIVGHTDTVGSDEANARLGLDRARLVAHALELGSLVPSERVFIDTHGEKNLLVPTRDKRSEPRNRRVEVTVR